MCFWFWFSNLTFLISTFVPSHPCHFMSSQTPPTPRPLPSIFSNVFFLLFFYSSSSSSGERKGEIERKGGKFTHICINNIFLFFHLNLVGTCNMCSTCPWFFSYLGMNTTCNIFTVPKVGSVQYRDEDHSLNFETKITLFFSVICALSAFSPSTVPSPPLFRFL